ncbi:MAG TPA: M20/M25/M40 family metallo-hydrolase [Chitinophagaceae bacterium]|nr:M20/M25/M40 family metallo-hydrolase [Chitinophagaceae bacterium]
MKKILIIAISFLFVTTCFSQKEDSIMIKKISDDILTNGKAYDNLRHLTKKIGGRLAGSPQMTMAEQWGEQVMRSGGADRVIMQECKVPHWVRGGEDKAEVVGGKKLDVVALGNSMGSGKKGVKAEVLLVNSYDDLEKKRDEVKDKIVFYNYKFNPTYIQTFRSYGEASPYRGSGPSRAAKYGAKAVIVRSMSHSTDNNPHTGATRYIDSFAKIPAVAIGLRDADWLSEELQKGKVSVQIKTNGHFLDSAIGHNVIGELTGSEFPNEIITVGGHLDSWDNCEGAHDDGAGCVQTIEILRAFKAVGYKPRRTIRFVLFANEENGLRGGNKYADEAKAKNARPDDSVGREKHIFALESDAGGFTPRAFGFTMSDEQFQKVLKWKPLIAPYGCSEFNRGGGGADIGPLRRAIPTTALAGLSPDSQRYFDIHHARNDVFENVNKRELELGAINMAALIYLIDKYGL